MIIQLIVNLKINFLNNKVTIPIIFYCKITVHFPSIFFEWKLYKQSYIESVSIHESIICSKTISRINNNKKKMNAITTASNMAADHYNCKIHEAFNAVLTLIISDSILSNI